MSALDPASLLALEPRWMFDGAAVADAADSSDDGDGGSAPANDSAPAHAPAAVAGPAEAVAPARSEVVFIQADLPDVESLVAGVAPGAEVYRLAAERDGLAQMREVLAGRAGIDALHLVGHGRDGALLLGDRWLGADDLERRAADLAAIGEALDAEGDLLLWGCDVAAGTEGHLLVARLAGLTGADVAASDDATGASGDWTLERATGAIEAALPFTAAARAAYAHDLAFPIGFGSSNGADLAKDIVTDSSGNVYVTGYFEGAMDADPGSGSVVLNSAGARDVFVAKYDPKGNLIWAKRLGGGNGEAVASIALDSAGNVLIAGDHFGSTQLDPDGSTAAFSGNGGFVVKLDSSGSFLWAKQAASSSLTMKGMSLDAADNIHLTGKIYGSTDFDPGAGTANLTPDATGAGLFVAKWDSSGSYLWAKQFNPTAGGESRAIDVDADGNVYTAGDYEGSIDTDPGPGNHDFSSWGYTASFISKLDSSGSFVWGRSIGGASGSTQVGDIAVGSSGDLHITGAVRNSTDLDPGPATHTVTALGASDPFVLKLSSAGNFIWAKSFAGAPSQFASGADVSVDGAGNVISTGYFYDTVDFDPDPGATANLTAHDRGTYVSKLTPSGDYAWASVFGAPPYGGIMNAQALTLDSDGKVLVTGGYRGGPDVDPGPGLLFLPSNGSSQMDVFIQKLGADGAVVPPNVSPTLTGLAASVTFAENTVNAGGQVIDADVTFADSDSADLDGGSLTVTGLRASETLSIASQAVGLVGGIRLSGSDVQVSDGAAWTTIGTLAGGAGSTLTISFNANATPTNVDALIQRLSYRSSSQNGESAHDLTLTVTDGDLNGTTGPRTISVSVTPEQDAPTAADGTVTATEDLAYSFAAGDFGFADVDSGDVLQAVQIVGLPPKGRLTLDGTPVSIGQSVTVADITAGKLQWAQDSANENGVGYTSFSFKVSDGNAFSAAANSLTIDVTAANDAPTDIALSNASVAENSGAGTPVGNLSTADFDSGDSFTYLVVSGGDKFQVSGDQLQVKAGANLDFETATSHEVRVRSTDSGGLSVETTFTIAVTNAVDPPSVTVNQGLTVSQGESKTLTGAMLAAHDTEQDDATLTFTLVTPPAKGTLQRAGVDLGVGGSFTQADLTNGLVSYVHGNGADAADSFVFTVSDGASGATGDTSFAITVNRDPTGAIADQSWNGSGPKSFQFAANAFTDPDGDGLSYSATLQGGGALPSWLSFDAASRTFSGNPPSGVASVALTVSAEDGKGGSASDDFTLSITNANDAPQLANAIPDQSWSGGGPKSFQVAANAFTDPDGDTLSYSATLQGGGALPSWLSFDAASCTFSGNPPVGLASVALTVTADDGNGGTASDDFSIAIANANDAPQVANPIPDQSWSGSGPKSFQFAADAFSDPDGDTLSYSASLTNGAALPSWLSFDSATRTVSGNPPSGVSSVALRVTAADGKGGTASDDFTISIANANDAPQVANAIPDQSWSGSGPKSFQVAADAFSDPDGDTLSYSATLQGGGALPSWLSFDAATRTFSGNPPAGLASVDLRVTVDDGNGGTASDDFTISIADANDAPLVANAIPDQSWSGGGRKSFQVAADAFTDPDGDTLSYSATLQGGGALPSWLSFDAATRTFSGNPPVGLASVALTVVAEDGQGGSASDDFTISIANANDAPLVANAIPDQSWSGSGPKSFQVAADTFSDPDGDTLSYSATLQGGAALPSWLSFDTSTRTFSGNPPAGLASVALTVTADDGKGGSASDDFTLSIANANDAPLVANAIPDQSWSGSGAKSFQVAADAFSDPDGDTLSYSATLQGGGALPSWLSFDAATRTFSGNPPAGLASVDLRVTVDDGNGGTASDDFTIAIADANDEPLVANAIPDQTWSGGGPKSFQVAADAFTDPDGDTLSYSATLQGGGALPSWLSFDASTRTFSGNPPVGLASIALTVTADDGKGGTASDDFSIAIADANDAPQVANAIPDQSWSGSGPKSFQVAADTFSDPDGDTLSYSATQQGGGALPSWLSFDASTRTFSGNPPAGLASVALTVTADDGKGGSASDDFAISIANANDAPLVANPIPDQSWSGGGPKSFQVAANAFTDPDGDALSYSATQTNGAALPSWLTFDAASRTFSGNPPGGLASIGVRVTAADGRGGTASDDFTISITGANDTATLAKPIPDQSWDGPGQHSYQVPADTFSADPDGDSLSYSATLQGGGALPAWLSFDAASRTFSGNPPAGAAPLDITVTADDGKGGALSDSFRLTPSNSNDAPIVAQPLAPQTLAAPGPWSYQVPAETFSDPDGDTLTYTASQADGSALPAWLTFDAASRSFSGTAPSGVPSLALQVTVDDGEGGSAASGFLLSIDQGTTLGPPQLAKAIPDQTWSGGGDHSFQVPADSFSDPDGDPLTLGATLANGAALPSWLSFDAATWTFSGSPPAAADGQTFAITVTAADGQQGVVSDSFDLSIANANDAPVMAKPLQDQSHSGPGTWTYQLPADAFTDADGDSLTYGAKLADGAALPSWLSFDAATRSFSGNPPAGLLALDLEVTASDPSGASAAGSFRLNITEANDTPLSSKPIASQHLASPGAWSFQVPADSFVDPDGDNLAWSASLADGRVLPAWLSFDAGTRTFSGTAPSGEPAIGLRVSVDDGKGGTAASSFQLTIGQGSSVHAPVLAEAIPDQSHSGAGAWTYQVPAETFADADGDPLTLAAALADDTALPAWLSFDAATRTFSGNPPADVATLDLKVTASDGKQGSAADVFRLTVTAANDAPQLANAIPDQTWSGSGPKSFQLAADAFSDPDGESLTYSTSLTGGGALPSWLSFDASTRTFAGNPPAGLSPLHLVVTASDAAGARQSSAFTLSLVDTNDKPVVAQPLDRIDLGKGGTKPIPAGTFADADGDDLSFRAALTGGGPLPAWLRFDSAQRAFVGTPPQGLSGELDLEVTVNDGKGGTATETFKLGFDNPRPAEQPQAPPPPPSPPSRTPPTRGPVAGPEPGGQPSGPIGLPGRGEGEGPSGPGAVPLPTAEVAGAFSLPAVTQASQGDGPAGGFRVAEATPTAEVGRDGALFVYKGIPNSIVQPGTVAFVVPQDAFGHTDEAAIVQLNAKLADGGPLPRWLAFDSLSGTFAGEAPAGFSATITVMVTARDDAGNEVTTLFQLIVGGGGLFAEDGDQDQAERPAEPDAGQRDGAAPAGIPGDEDRAAAPPAERPERDPAAQPEGRASLTQQLRAAKLGGPGQTAGQTAIQTEAAREAEAA